MDEADPSSHHVIRKASASKDIWSLGCVLSEAAVWSVLGKGGLAEYRIQRKLATDQLPGLSSTADSGCFHDGEKVLDAVFDMHHRVRNDRRQNDTIIVGMLSIIEDMLDDVSSRPNGHRVYARIRNLLHRNTALSPWPSNFRVSGDSVSPRALPPELPPGVSQSPLGITIDRDTGLSLPYLHPRSSVASPVSPPLDQSDGVEVSPSTLSPRPRFPSRTDRDLGGNEHQSYLRYSTGSSLAIQSPHPMCDLPLESHKTSPLPDGTPPMVNRTVITTDTFSKTAFGLPIKQAGILSGRVVSKPNSYGEPERDASTRQPLPEASIGQIETWIRSMKQSTSTLPLVGHGYLRNLCGRDQVYVAKFPILH
jgi:hypothetical protein